MLLRLLLAVLRKVFQNPTRWLPDFFRAAAEGRLGPQVKAIYDFLKGKKTWTGFILVAAAYVLRFAEANGLFPDGGKYAGYVEAVGQFLILVGLMDASFRASGPDPVVAAVADVAAAETAVVKKLAASGKAVDAVVAAKKAAAQTAADKVAAAAAIVANAASEVRPPNPYAAFDAQGNRVK